RGDAAVLRITAVAVGKRDGGPFEGRATGGPLTGRGWVGRAPGGGVVPGGGVGLVRDDGLVCLCGSAGRGGGARRARTDGRVAMEPLTDGRFAIALHIPELPLLGGSYYVNVATTDDRGALLAYDVRERLAPFRVRNPSHEYGVMRIGHRWTAAGASPHAG